MVDLWKFRTLQAVVVALIAVSPSAGRADATRSAAAEALFSEARRLSSEGRHSEACPKYEESQRLDPAIGTQFNLAACYEKIGRTASAWAAFLEVSYSARAAGQGDRERVAKQRADSLEPNLARAVLSTEGRPMPAGIRVTRDGLAIGSAQWNVPVPVDPGEHSVEVSASGFKPWKSTFVAAPGSTARIALPADLEPEAQPVAPAAPAAVNVPRPAGPVVLPVTLAPEPESDAAGRSQRGIGWTIGALGVAGAVVGTVYGLKARATNEDSLSYCREKNLCQAEGVALRDDARAYGNVSTVAFAVGGAALAGGLLVLLTAPSSQPARRPGLSSAATWNQGPSIALEGTW